MRFVELFARTSLQVTAQLLSFAWGLFWGISEQVGRAAGFR